MTDQKSLTLAEQTQVEALKALESAREAGAAVFSAATHGRKAIRSMALYDAWLDVASDHIHWLTEKANRVDHVEEVLIELRAQRDEVVRQRDDLLRLLCSPGEIGE